MINVEMQLFNKYDTEKRTLFDWSKQYGSQLVEGQSYSSLKRCITINILNFSFLPNDRYHNFFHLREDQTGIPLIDDIEIHMLELPKLKKAMTTLEFLSQDREACMQYEARQKYLHDEASLMEAAKNAEIYGFKTGLELSTIAGVSGLSMDEIRRLQNEQG